MRRSVAYLFAVILLVPGGWSQNHPKAHLGQKLLSVHVKGLQRLPEDKVVGATGLQLGRNVTEQDFQQAVQRLGDSGLFTDVAYSYHYTTAGCDLELRLTENPKLVPVVFDNFVWFSDAELNSLLRTRRPLFDGRLPLGGGLSDQVREALRAILEERKISGDVDGIETAQMNGPIDSYTYTVSLHPVIVRNVEFPGAATAEAAVLQTAAKALTGQAYLRSTMRPHEELDFLPIYRARGYLKAQFAESQAKIVEDGARTVVDASCPVSPGIQYKTRQIQWKGASAFPADKLQAMLHMPVGEPADAVQLQTDLDAVRKLYGTKGYLRAHVKPIPLLEDSAAAVSYQLEVVEGDVFHMGDLQIDGIDPGAAARLAAQWQMKKGDVFDDSYMKRFFEVMYHNVGLSRSYDVVPKQTVDPLEKVVNVVLHFVLKK